MMAAFFDELEKIGEAEMEKRASPARVAYELRKEANWLSSLSTSLLGHGREIGQALRSGGTAAAEEGVTRVAGHGGSFLGGIGRNLVNTVHGFSNPLRGLKEGWNYGGQVMKGGKLTYETASKLPGKGWLGVGKQGEGAWETATSLGGATKYLPVGPKALTVGFAATELPAAVAEEDPTGEGRSRAERIGNFAGNLGGGLIGAPHGMSGSVAGSMLGSYAGGKAGKVLKGRKPAQPPPENLPMPDAAQPENTR